MSAIPDPATDPEIEALCAQGWRLEAEGRVLARSYRFTDFGAAIGWMTQVALLVEARDHHPDWRNRYSRVEVELTSHDIGGLSRRDTELAAAMERLARRTTILR